MHRYLSVVYCKLYSNEHDQCDRVLAIMGPLYDDASPAGTLCYLKADQNLYVTCNRPITLSIEDAHELMRLDNQPAMPIVEYTLRLVPTNYSSEEEMPNVSADTDGSTSCD